MGFSLKTSTSGSGGSTSLWIGSAAMIPRATSGCGINSIETSTNRVNLDVLEFDTATDEFAQVLLDIPNNWNSGTISIRFYWTAASGSGGVAWQASALAFSDGTALDTARGTAQVTTDTLLSASQMHITDSTPLITIAGSPSSTTPILIEVSRVTANGSDTLATDAQLIGIELTYTGL